MEVHEGERVSILDIWWGVTQGSCRGAYLGDCFWVMAACRGGVLLVSGMSNQLSYIYSNINLKKKKKVNHILSHLREET